MRFRKYHARKNSRFHNLKDLFDRSMDSTDLIASTMSSASRVHNKKHLALLKSVQKLLSVPEVTNLIHPDSGAKSDMEE